MTTDPIDFNSHQAGRQIGCKPALKSCGKPLSNQLKLELKKLLFGKIS